MRIWAQSWQAATWPPSAAVRQLSMADMTLSWPRLKCPARAWRQAGPWARKMSATSSPSRGMTPPPGSGGRQLQMLQRALDRVQGGAGDLGVARGGVELGMPEQHLDHADVDLLFQEMGGKAVPERM